MTKNKKVALLTSLITLLPMIYGLVVYQKLPTQMATHFSVDNTPNGFMPKPVAVIGLPILMLVIQLVLVLTTTAKQNTQKDNRFFVLLPWLIPILTVVLYVSTILFNLGHAVNIWQIAISLIGLLFIVLGNYFPTLDNTKKTLNPSKQPAADKAWRKARRPLGLTLVLGGLLLLVSLLFTPVFSIVILILIVLALLILPLIYRK